MRINHNISAINANRQLSSNQGATSKSLQKLSSGLRINTAGDDAAGLAISEKMRSQIRGLAKAQSNAQDSISLIQTAEGALQQVSDILQRMRELAVQSMNGILSATEKESIGSEMTQLRQEVDRIAETSKFNNTYLLKGTLGMSTDTEKSNIYKTDTADLIEGIKTVDVAAAEKNTEYKIHYEEVEAKAEFTGYAVLGTDDDKTGAKYVVPEGAATVKLSDATGMGATTLGTTIRKVVATDATDPDNPVLTTTYQLTSVADPSDAGDTTYACSDVFVIPNDVAATDIAYIGDTTILDTDGEELNLAGQAGKYIGGTTIPEVKAAKVLKVEFTPGNDLEGTKKVYTYTLPKGAEETEFSGFASFTLIDEKEETESNAGIKIQFSKMDLTKYVGDNGTEANTADDEYMIIHTTDGGKTNLQIGANPEDAPLRITIPDLRSGEGALEIKELSVNTTADAKEALNSIDDALTMLNSARGSLGAYQNRLEYTLNSLAASEENLTAAESRIRDVDMAKEMVTYTQANILNQSATAMLSQANQQPQQVLQLLQGL